MQAKIMERKDYDSSKRDPIGLLQAIKELSLSYQDTKYDMKIITSAIKTFVNLKQKDDESLIDYTNRFKTARDVLKAQLGSELVLHKVVNADANYQEGDSEAIKDNNTKIIKKHYDRWIAYVYLENSDKNKYGSLINGLDSQQSLGTNQYPTTLGKATEVLSNHRFDAAYLEQKKKRNRHTSNNTESESKHKQDSNDSNEEPKLSFATIEGKCYCCGKPGHKSPECRQRNKIPRNEWAINKVAKNENIHVHSKGSSDDDNTSSTQISNVQETKINTTDNQKANEDNRWSFAQIGFQLTNPSITKNLKDLILLDNQSSKDLFGNSNMITNIHKAKTVMQMQTNGGMITNNHKATLPNYGEVWYNPSAITNILSFAKLKDKANRITYDSNKEDAFVVHTKQGEIRFNRTDNNLYVMDPKQQKMYQMMETVDDNMKHYTQRQIERAKAARALYHSLGTPTIKDYKAIIRMNAIRNCPITMEDIDIAEAIYGQDIGNIKGKQLDRNQHQ